MLGLFRWIRDALGQVNRDRLQRCQEDLEKCKTELEQLKNQNIELQAQNNEYKKKEQFIDLGCCLAPKNRQTYLTPHCPNCTRVMSKYGVNYKCEPCNYTVSFSIVKKAYERHNQSSFS